MGAVNTSVNDRECQHVTARFELFYNIMSPPTGMEKIFDTLRIVFNRFERHFLHRFSVMAIIPFKEHTNVTFNFTVLFYSTIRVYIT